MSKLERITAFITVVEENGFAAAAKKQNVSTAAISRQITTLEAELNTQLLHRTTRQLALTDLGERYYQQCKKVVADLAEAETEILGAQQEATGTLNVTSNRYFASEYLLPRLSEFMVLNPKLRINLELAERFPDFATEEVDILFGVSMEGAPGLIRRRVSTTRYVMCASPAYLKKFGIPKNIGDLKQHRYITHSMRKPNNVLTFKDGKEIQVEPILWLNDTRAMCECALHDMGIVRLHDYVVAEALQAKQLVEVLVNYQEPQQYVYLYYQQSRYLQPKIRRFIDFYLGE